MSDTAPLPRITVEDDEASIWVQMIGELGKSPLDPDPVYEDASEAYEKAMHGLYGIADGN